MKQKHTQKVAQDENAFFSLFARYANTSETTLKKMYGAMVDAIIRELYLYGYVYLPDVGYIMLRTKPKSIYSRRQNDGTYVYYESPVKSQPYFVPDDNFINDVNMRGVTSSCLARAIQGAKSARDKDRERMAKEFEAAEEVVEPAPDEAEIAQLKNRFAERLQKMKTDFENRIFNQNEEEKE